MSTPAAARAVDAALEASVVGSFTRVGFRLRAATAGWEPPVPATGRTVVVTGATSGLGRAAAEAFVDDGAHVIAVGRDASRLARAEHALRDRAATGARDGSVRALRADISVLAEVRRLADEIDDAGASVDVLVHNAGSLTTQRTTTAEGHETTVATHVLGPFLLTALLIPSLRRAGGRVLTMASGGMYAQRLSVDDLVMPAVGYRGTTAYSRAKRAQVELTAAWAERVEPRSIAFAALHPGWVDTPGLAASLPRFGRIMGPLLREPAQGIDTLRWLATAEDPVARSGAFWHDRRPRRTTWFPWTAAPAGERDRLWRWCRDAVGGSGLPEGWDLVI